MKVFGSHGDYIYIYMVPETLIFWLFQLDDSKPLHQQTECFTLFPPKMRWDLTVISQLLKEKGVAKKFYCGWASVCFFYRMKSAISCRFDPKTRRQSIVIFSNDWGVKSPPKRIICAFRYHAHKVGGNTCSVPLWFSGLCLTCWVRSRKKSLNLFMSVQTYSRENPISKQWMKFHGIEVAYIANWGWLYITYTPPIKRTSNSWNTVEYFQPLTQTYPIISPMVPVFIRWGLISDIPLKSSRAKTPKKRLVGWRSFLFGCFVPFQSGRNLMRSMKPVEIYEALPQEWGYAIHGSFAGIKQSANFINSYPISTCKASSGWWFATHLKKINMGIFRESSPNRDEPKNTCLKPPPTLQ